MSWHPLLKAILHRQQRLIVQRNMVAVHSKNLRPPFSTGVFETQVDVGESLLDLGLDVGGDDARFGIPAAWVGLGFGFCCR